MATYKLGDMRRWASAQKEKQLALVQHTVTILGDIAQTPVSRGGRMPVLTGDLRRSFRTRRNGRFAGWGEDAHYKLVAVIQVGDKLQFSWGNQWVQYAMAQNYGYTVNGIAYPGKHWIEFTAAHFQSVTERVAKMLGAST